MRYLCLMICSAACSLAAADDRVHDLGAFGSFRMTGRVGKAGGFYCVRWQRRCSPSRTARGRQYPG